MSGRDAWRPGRWRHAGRGDGRRALVMAAAVTPFRGEGIDYAGFEENLRFQDAMGVDGVLVAGTTGERVHLTLAERDALVEVARKVLAREVIIVAGTAAAATGAADVRTDLDRLAELGADLALVPPPWSPEDAARDDDELAPWFGAVAAGAALPVLIYHPPAFAGRPLSDRAVCELRALPEVAGVKDSVGDERLVDLWMEAESDRFAVLVGNAPLFGRLAGRVTGGILALASVAPEPYVALARAAARGEDVSEIRAGLREVEERFARGRLAELKEMHEEVGLFGGERRAP